MLGLDQHQAEATSLLAIVPVVLVGSWRQSRYGNIRWGAVWKLGLGSLAGVVAGGLLAERLAPGSLQRLFGVPDDRDRARAWLAGLARRAFRRAPVRWT